MNWKPEICGIFLHRKPGSLLFCLRVLQMLPVENSMVLFSSFLLKHFPSNCDLFYFFFKFLLQTFPRPPCISLTFLLKMCTLSPGTESASQSLRNADCRLLLLGADAKLRL